MKKYAESTHTTKRRKTREVMVGTIGIGGENPLRIQSMTTTKTSDIAATVDQVIALADAGCEIVRVTVQGKKEADACEHIKNTLLKKGYSTPLVADIHFYPPAALRVAEFVDKVRINPGNFADRRAIFEQIDYSDSSYAEEIAHVEEKFAPLILKCREGKKAIRIGTNHGSLSDRILSRYGDTPRGMVESALEYATLCRKYDFHDIIFSMKASNTLIMIQAYRLLAAEMYARGWDYPLHLGVTEAGMGIDGRIKSAIGIGALLVDGLGDTIRVSLSEDPLAEIPACLTLKSLYEKSLEQELPFFEEHCRKNTSLETNFPLPSYDFLHPNGTVLVSKLSQNLDPDVTGVEENDSRFQWLSEGEVPPSFDRPCIIQNAESPTHAARALFEKMHNAGSSVPILLAKHYSGTAEEIALKAGYEMGPALADGIVQGVFLFGDKEQKILTSMSFSLLQGCRMRMSKTEFIACPSCGRTLFNLMDVTKRIEEKTAHLPGVKIAIMGCIVNGPGEMADADFGYVGSKTGMVDLYVGKTCVERGIPESSADQRLIDLIKAHGKWIDKIY